MIDFSTEDLIPLRDVPRHVPSRSNGKRTHISTGYRWAKKGRKGIILETIQIGGTRCTSREALARFFQRLTFGNGSAPEAPPSPARRRRAAERAERELAREGV